MTRLDRHEYRARMLKLAIEIVMHPDYELALGSFVEVDITELADDFMRFVESGTVKVSHG